MLSSMVQGLNLGNGSTWPGHIALKTNKHIIRDLLAKTKMQVILIAGTNGKTTTATLLKSALELQHKRVLQNESGANLLNGIASTLLLHASTSGRINYDVAIFEVDENALPLVVKEITPSYVVLLNLFRDQLDRYGEVNTIVTKWKHAISQLSEKTTLVLNADDPQIAYLAIAHTKGDNLYFGLQDAQFSTKETDHAADSVSCPKCGARLQFEKLAFSHLGKWKCPKCDLKRPAIKPQAFSLYPLPGLYNKYNTLAAKLVLQQLGFSDNAIDDAFAAFKPAFGRQEIVEYKGKKVQLFLSKNPTSFNQSYATMQEMGAKHLLLILNDRIPDGRDISWIWDVDLPQIQSFEQIIIAGDRAYDMALRVKYEDYKDFQTFENLQQAIDAGVDGLGRDQTLYVLPTYSAMLEVRKILTGKKIL